MEAPREPDRMPAPRAKVRRGERRAAGERVTHGGDGGWAHKRHVGERDDIGIGLARGARRAREAAAHAFVGVLAYHGLAALGGKRLARVGMTHDDHHARQLRFQVPRGLHRDGHAMRQPMAQLVGAEARGGACREQQAYDVQVVGCLTSQAEGSKRRSGFAAQVGSLTPWRTAVISARIATAISGGVFEPM